MDVDWFYRIVALIILLLFSAIFSGSEVAFFSIDKKKKEQFKNETGIIEKYIIKLLALPRRLLVTILIGNTITNVAASILSVSLALGIAQKYNYSLDLALLIQIITLTVIIILFAEITPKVLANKYPISFAKTVSIPLYFTSILLFPISVGISKILKIVTAKVKYDKSKTALSTSEITELANIGVEKGTLEEEEHGLIHGLVAFKSVTVREVMTPRVDMTTLSEDISFKELVDTIKESGHSRIPVYSSNLDNIIGILYAKDLLPYLNSNISQNNFDLGKIIRDCLFVPETKQISDLMQEFQTKKMHMSIVVDEYGGTSGLITLEDILEEIVGEIRDEFDEEDEDIVNIGEDKYLISGKADIEEVEENLGINIEDPDEDFETIGGYIFNQAGTIPEVGYTFEEYGYRFKVIEVDSNRITKVEIEKVEDPNN